jgi:chromosome segregation ATPase
VTETYHILKKSKKTRNDIHNQTIIKVAELIEKQNAANDCNDYVNGYEAVISDLYEALENTTDDLENALINISYLNNKISELNSEIAYLKSNGVFAKSTEEQLKNTSTLTRFSTVDLIN